MSISEKPIYVLFYMNNCKFCKNLISKIKQKPELLKKINLVDIDSIPEIPDEVDEVPCIYDGKQVYTGENAFKWFNEKSIEFLSPADDNLMYSFINGDDEQVFDKFSLLEQRNGSFGMGDVVTQNGNQNSSNKTMANLESLMNSRTLDMKDFSK
jgi:nicotinic acid phosphoribosyltransferase